MTTGGTLNNRADFAMLQKKPLTRMVLAKFFAGVETKLLFESRSIGS